MDGILTLASSEISKAFNNSITAITNTHQQQIDIIKKESQEYGIRAGQAKVLEEELNWARMIFSIVKFPSEAKNLPSDFALLLLPAINLINGATSQASFRDSRPVDEDLQ